MSAFTRSRVSRVLVKTRAGVRDIRVERRSIPAEDPAPVPVASAECAMAAHRPLGRLAREISHALDGQIVFPARFWKVGNDA